MSRDYIHYMDRARALLAAGFHTKSGRKDATELVGYAFGFVREALHESMMMEWGGALRWQGMTDKQKQVYDSIPFSAAHWNAKRRVLLAAHPLFQSFLENLDAAAALRAEIVAAPTVAKLAPKRTPAQLADDAKRRTCQICARMIYAEVGVIAHHGYERPGYGWQTDSCTGARELPYEASRDVLLDHITAMKARLEGMTECLAATKRDAGPCSRGYKRALPKTGKRWEQTQYSSHSVTFTRETMPAALYFAAPAFETYTGYGGVTTEGKVYWHNALDREKDLYDLCLAQEIAGQESAIKSLREYIVWQQGRTDAWVRMERWQDEPGKWIPNPALIGVES